MQAAPVLHDALSGDEKESLDRVLDDCYGIPWCLSVLDLKLYLEGCDDHAVMEPIQIF